MTRAATTLADPCTGAPRRDFLLGLRHGQLVGAHVPSWCSGHGVDAGCSQRAGPPGQLTATRHLRKVQEWTPPTASACQDGGVGIATVLCPTQSRPQAKRPALSFYLIELARLVSFR